MPELTKIAIGYGRTDLKCRNASLKKNKLEIKSRPWHNMKHIRSDMGSILGPNCVITKDDKKIVPSIYCYVRLH